MSFFDNHGGGLGNEIANRLASDLATGRGVDDSSANQQVRRLEDTVDRLTLVCMALWSLTREKTGLTEEDLFARVQEIDLRDGVADGKVTPTPQTCTNCRRTISARHRRCIYCGSETPKQTAFDAI